jgi:proteasome lid subunit RPN8/RPN11
LQRNADREKRIQELEQELERRDWKKKWGDRLFWAFMILLIVCLGFFVHRVTPINVDGGVSTEPTTVSFTESHVQWLDENYNSSVENGFCLFGHVDGEEVVVEQVELIDNPVSQSRDSMTPTCIPQIYARSNQLLLNKDYRFVGLIHTHPEYATLSELDRRTFHSFDSVLTVFGVYNGEKIAMYSDWNQSRPIYSVLRFN